MTAKRVYYKKPNYKKLIISLIKKKYFSLFIGLTLSYFFSLFIYQNFIFNKIKGINLSNFNLPKNFKLTKNITPTPTVKKNEKKYRTYTVQEGDSLSLISQKFYGDLYQWPKILEANHLSNPDLIEVGMVLIIP